MVQKVILVFYTNVGTTDFIIGTLLIILEILFSEAI